MNNNSFTLNHAKHWRKAISASVLLFGLSHWAVAADSAAVTAGNSDIGAMETAPARLPVAIPKTRPNKPKIARPKHTSYIETGDLSAIKERGQLRILVPRLDETSIYLPRNGTALDWQREVAENFARSQDLEPVLVTLTSLEEALPMLLQGKVDLIAANLTVTETREQVIDFSHPFAHVKEQVLVRSDDAKLQTAIDLNGRTIVADPSSAFWVTANTLRMRAPEVQVEPAAMIMDESMLDKVASGEIDTTIMQSNLVDAFMQYRSDIRVAFNAAIDRPVAWAMRRDSDELRTTLNRFLTRNHLTDELPNVLFGDWAAIKKRGVLRVLLRNNAVSYFLWRGELVGFEFEMLKMFANKHKLRLQVIVPESRPEMLQWLKEGRADIAAGFLQSTETDPELAYTRSYHTAPPMLIARQDDPIANVDELAGRTIAIADQSPYAASLQGLLDGGKDFKVDFGPAEMDTTELMLKVANGQLDLTVAGGPTSGLPKGFLTGLKADIALGDPQPHGWAIRSGNPALLKQLNGFLAKNKRGSKMFNILWFKYFGNKGRLKRVATDAVKARKDGKLSPYDHHVRNYAKRYDFDWRLIVSQMYQESGFNPKTKSWAGASGLMQVMPRTAKQMGFKNVQHPETGIHAGIKYMHWLRKQIDDQLPYRSRIWFTLASYNAGLGHVLDARRLAEQKGWDKNRWFDNVEKAMLLLAQPKYAKKARHGFVRGSEPVNYVRNIRDRYQVYQKLLENTAQRQLISAPTLKG